MESVRSFTDVPIGPIQDFLSKCDQPFETSQLYSAARDAKFVDEDLRKSVFRAIRNESGMFDLVDDVVQQINESDDNFRYQLRRDDVTHIKYESGGFFKRHKDYLSTTSNMIEEFTLIVCVTPDDLAANVSGGDTTIFTYGGATTFDTSTPGCALLFRKDLEHEGTELKRGGKHIVTANIWATRKEQTKQVLLVTFPTASSSEQHQTSEIASSRTTRSRTAAAEKIEQAASASSSYVLPVSILTGMLAAHVQWANRNAEERDEEIPPVVAYECHDFDFKTFGVVEKILKRSYVDERSIEECKEALDYYGPFEAENLLVDLAVEANSGDATQQKGDDSSDEEEQPLKKQKSGSGGSTDSGSIPPAVDPSFDTEVIVCENEARMRAVADVARVLNEPYVPFKMLLVEGVLETGGEMGLGAVDIPITPAACLVGDYNNVFSLWKCAQKSTDDSPPLTLNGVHSNCNFWDLIPRTNADALMNLEPGTEIRDLFKNLPREEDKESGWGGRYDLHYKLRRDGYGLGLRLGFGPTINIKALVARSVFEDAYPEGAPENDLAFLPGSDAKVDAGSKGSDTATGVAQTSALFHRDGKGLTTFSREEARLASDYIAKIGLDERVKASLQKKRFDLPQESSNVEAQFCNESVYGKVNILWVCGVIRLEEPDRGQDGAQATPAQGAENEAESDSSDSSQFDAWPAPAAKETTLMRRGYITAMAQMQGFDY